MFVSFDPLVQTVAVATGCRVVITVTSDSLCRTMQVLESMLNAYHDSDDHVWVLLRALLCAASLPRLWEPCKENHDHSLR